MNKKLLFATIVISIITILSAIFLHLIDYARENFIVSIIYMIVIASFYVYYFIKDTGNKGILVLIIISLFAYLIENIGIITGFPYGNFIYSETMGPKIFHVQITLPLAFVPLVIASYVLTNKIKNNIQRISIMTGVLVLFDLVIDPGAVALKMWIWENPGIYYGIPFKNFLGWILSGAIASSIMVYILDSNKKKHNNIHSTLTVFYLMIFYLSICILKGMIIPSIIAAGIVGYLLFKYSRKQYII